MQWSPQQDAAIGAVRAWLADPGGKQVFRLFGYAGTGKTTLAQEIARLVKGRVAYGTLTGKAALVLRKKGCDDASTLHLLIYKVEVDEATGEVSFKLNPDSALTDAKLLIVDEVSMVGEALALDILSYGVRVLVLGDPAQLPPVEGEGYFINAEPDVMLTEVHRQALDNPIIRMSMEIRDGRLLMPGQYGDSLVMLPKQSNRDERQRLVLEADQLICGMNRSRVTFNTRIRSLKGLLDEGDHFLPVVGDRLICLRNKYDEALFNGSLWQAEQIETDSLKLGDAVYHIRITSLDEERDPQTVKVLSHFFAGTERELHWKLRRGFHEFTFGWAITCHKAQGSQWDNVIVFDESRVFREHRQNWLYTAITRAAERVTVVL